jgi:methanogenic corrinoid protein MtbC1
MSPPDANRFAAEILQSSCQGLAGYAAGAMIEKHPDTARRFGEDAFAGWKADVAQRVQELAAALRMGESQVFVARVRWARKAFQARNESGDYLRASLEALRSVIGERLPERARAGALDYLDQGLAALAAPAGPPPERELDPAQPHDRLALGFLQKVLSGDTSGGIREVADAVAGGLPVTTAYLQVLLPAEREVGRLWHSAQVSVAEEHLVTFAVQRAMAVLMHQAPPARPNGRTAVIAAVAKNAHDIGLRATADLYQLAGWRSIFLGADVPEEDLPGMLGYFDADVLLLGVSLAPQLPRASQAIELLRERCERRVQIIVGGAAIDEAPDVWKTLGADGYAADLATVEQLGAHLAGQAS